MRHYLNWKSFLAIIALIIVGASLLYTNRLAQKLAEEEKKKVVQLADALKDISKSTNNQETALASNIITQNTTIPLIVTDEHNKIIDFNNIDTDYVTDHKKLLLEKLHEFRRIHKPIMVDFGIGKQYVYYGESSLLIQLRYFPYVLLTIIFIFLAVVLFALTTANKSLQNQVWVGLSKETAHQLGTPLSSIEAWMELLKDSETNPELAVEMQKDVDRLKLVADRFSKVGSAPKMEMENMVDRLQDIVSYMQKRAPNKVIITLHHKENDIRASISGSLFDWVMENLIRNALDAMEGKGKIDLTISGNSKSVVIDVQDTGKGIPSHLVKKIFNPGFTTKKRGWGLGLSLSRRIIEQYHKGSIFVKHSEVGKGTTFRIILRR